MEASPPLFRKGWVVGSVGYILSKISIDTSSRKRPYWGDSRHELLGWFNKLAYSQQGLADIYNYIDHTQQLSNMVTYFNIIKFNIFNRIRPTKY